MKGALLLLILFLILPLAYANSGHIKLLAVTEGNDTMEGSIADLFLDIQPGTGRVFLETFPLSKLDTQMSTRFAKEIACDFIDFDCSKYDFFYTIKATSAIVGGPSAGAAASLLTLAVLKDIKIPSYLSITGTINSGGMIGPVGGVKEKIEAASKSGIRYVLIPLSEERIKEKNQTLDLIKYGRKLDVNVTTVSDLNDAFRLATGIILKEKPIIKSDRDYEEIMAYLANDLCNRSRELSAKAESEEAKNLTTKGKRAYELGNYYTSASFCFGANVKYQTDYFFTIDQKTLANISDNLKQKINNFRKNMPEIKNINYLQAYMAVEERLYEAEDSIKSFENETNQIKKSKLLAYANERIYSAESWSKFFNMPGKSLNIAQKDMKESCIQKISETEERVEYLSLLLPNNADSLREGIKKTYSYFNKGNYAMCLLNAIKTKSEANIILSSLYIDEKNIGLLLDQKLNAAERVIAEETSKGNFPIMGYSYYDYAKNLQGSDNYSALLYSEYAIELSKLDIYFKKKAEPFKITIDLKSVVVLICGIFIGSVSTIIIRRKQKIKGPTKKHKR